MREYHTASKKQMDTAITIFISALLTFIAQEIRQRARERKKPTPTVPPPPEANYCKKCYFFKEFKRRNDFFQKNTTDTQIIKIWKEDEK